MTDDPRLISIPSPDAPPALPGTVEADFRETLEQILGAADKEAESGRPIDWFFLARRQYDLARSALKRHPKETEQKP